MGLLSLIGLALISDIRRAVYVAIVTLLIGAAAAWLGISANHRARGAGSRRLLSAVSGTVLGVLGFAFSAVIIVVFAVFWHQLDTYSNCLSGANTLSAQHICQRQLNQAIRTEVKALNGSGG